MLQWIRRRIRQWILQWIRRRIRQRIRQRLRWRIFENSGGGFLANFLKFAGEFLVNSWFSGAFLANFLANAKLAARLMFPKGKTWILQWIRQRIRQWILQRIRRRIRQRIRQRIRRRIFENSGGGFLANFLKFAGEFLANSWLILWRILG